MKTKAAIDYSAPAKRMKEHKKSPGYRRAYEEERLMYEMAELLHEEREKHGFTQKKLAQHAGLKQQEISRLERGNSNTTIKTLMKVAHGMGKRITIKFS